MLYIYSWFIWLNISHPRWHEGQVKDMSDDNLPFWTLVLSGEGWLVENYIYYCYSCPYSSALWTLYLTIYYELCNPKVDVILPNWRSESQGAIYPYEWCSYYELRASGGWGWWRRKQTEQTPSWKQDSILGQTVDFELYAQYLWKWHTNWKTRPPGWKSPRAHT